MLPMLRTLLADRFGLQLRREEKEFPVYNLVADKGGPKLRPLKEVEPSRCTRDNSFICGIRTTAVLAESLKNIVGRPVFNETKVQGRFDILLDFDVYAIRGMATPPDYDKPQFATALREQLGLRLEPAKRMLPVLVVEKIDRPPEN
jgi:uncharacterized protein (TIGR03435 family)